MRELADATLSQPKWQAVWYLTNSIFTALTCLALSRWGYLPWGDMEANLLVFFVQIGVYGLKYLFVWYRYQGRYGTYGISERYYELALELIEKDNWEEALRYLEAILRVMPDHLRALYYASVCKENLGDDEGAIVHVTEYLKVKPDDEEALELQIRVSQS